MVRPTKKLFVVPLLIAVLTFGLAFSGMAVANTNHSNDARRAIVGAWEVTAVAPYAPHLFTFHADGTMSTTNPTNVQEDVNAPHGGTNDSLGMGAWGVQRDNGHTYIIGTFEQLNAYADNHEPTDKLSVSFKISVDGDSFDGPAVAELGSDTVPSHVTGTRITVDQTAVDSL